MNGSLIELHHQTKGLIIEIDPTPTAAPVERIIGALGAEYLKPINIIKNKNIEKTREKKEEIKKERKKRK